MVVASLCLLRSFRAVEDHVSGHPSTVERLRETGKPTAVGGARLFETTYVLPQLRLFALDEAGRPKDLELETYAPRHLSGPILLQEVLFPYLEAL